MPVQEDRAPAGSQGGVVVSSCAVLVGVTEYISGSTVRPPAGLGRLRPERPERVLVGPRLRFLVWF